jgi:nitrite reductase (NADH) large subunit
MAKERIVVIGCGLAGASLVEALLAKTSPDAVKIDVLATETQGAYDRLDLPRLLDGGASEAGIIRYDRAWFEQRGVRLHTGCPARFVDRFRRQVQADDLVLPYDKLVFATGSSAYLPPIFNLLLADGQLHHGAFTFRTLSDCSALSAALSTMRRIAVLGGGPLGVELSRALTRRGAEVHVFHVGKHLMRGQLDDSAAAILKTEVEALGAQVHFGLRATRIVGDGQLSGLAFTDGTTFDCDAVVVAAGCQPDTWLGFQCGLSVERGIVVDSHMRSVDDLNVYALGECAQWRASIHGSPQQITEQARVIAEHLTTRYSEHRYLGQRSALNYEVAGLRLCTMGCPESNEGDDVALLFGPGRARYKKVVIRRGRLVSAILIGDLRQASSLNRLYSASAPMTDDAQDRLFDLCVPFEE